MEGALAQFGRCLIVDVHSFSSRPLPHEPDQTVPRPDVCVGFDPFHAPFRDEGAIRRTCEAQGFSCDVNRPFAGSIVPQRHWNADARVRSFMLEVRRDLYMDEEFGNALADFAAISGRVRALLDDLARQFEYCQQKDRNE